MLRKKFELRGITMETL